MMNEREKSDPAIVAMKPTNKAGRPAAESVERRAGAKGNADQQSTRRAQNRDKRDTGAGPHTASRKAKEEGDGSPRFSTMSTSICCGRRFSRSSAMPPRAWTA